MRSIALLAGKTKEFDGYSTISNLVTKSCVEELKEEILRLQEVAKPDWLEKNSAKCDEDRYLVIRSVDTPSDMLFSFARKAELIQIVEEFAGMRVTPLYVEFFDKPPFSNLPTPPHQDHAFYNSHFPDELGVTIWLALDDCDEENGCMMVAPNRERQLLPHRSSPATGFGLELCDKPQDAMVPICLETGSALVHGSYTIHACNGNNSGRSRRALAFSYRTSSYRQQFV